MRAMVPELDTPYPLGSMLPAVFQEDPVAMRLTGALDAVLAPVISTLDCVHGYVDPQLAPPDFLTWLAGWVGLELDDRWPPERQRALVRRMITLYRSRGTVDGLREHVELVTGGQVEVADNGGVVWSTTPGTDFPDTGELLVTVRVRGVGPGSVNANAVDALVDSAKPAHVPHQVELSAH